MLSLCPSNPNGKYLCPAFTSQGCNCQAWPGLSSCPRCDDLDAVPPLMMSLYPDAEYGGGIELGECPPEADTCFSYCVTKSMSEGGGSTHCAYGCAQSKQREALELVVAARLSDVDYEWRRGRNKKHFGTGTGQLLTNALSPITYKCDSGVYGCTTTFCKEDGCNKGAMTFYARWGRKLIIGAWLLFGSCACFIFTPCGELCCQGASCFAMSIAGCLGAILSCFGTKRPALSNCEAGRENEDLQQPLIEEAQAVPRQQAPMGTAYGSSDPPQGGSN